ncbi:MAG TPA: glycosyltransferase family 4 protein [Dehalococcoidia bacterium]|nr:glycosyltransferase family 4 protein [Dehalococcoidia bacterium]
MNILMLSALDVWSLPGGSGAPSLYRTLKAYGERGHRVHYLAPTVGANHFGPIDDPAIETPAPQITNVTFTRFPVPSVSRWRVPWPQLALKADQKMRFAAAFPVVAARRAEDVLRSEPIDLLYAYEVHGCLAARVLQRHSKLPTVCRFQGTVMHPTLDNPLARARRYEEVLALRTPAGLYIMTNDGTRGDEVLARLNPHSEGRVRFWRNGLDMDRLKPAAPRQTVAAREALGIPGDRFALMTACVLLPWKHVDRAVRALAQIRRQLPEALLIVLGDGEERANLEALARELGVADSVRFEGAVPHSDVLRYLWAADVFLSLNDLSNVGNPLLEAMACGKPIVTIDNGATADLIRDAETGLLLPSGDPQRVTDAVLRLAQNRTLRRRIARGARAHATANFWTWEQRLAAELEEVERLVIPA